MADHLLAIDAGTSGARCLVVRPDGTCVAVRQEWSYETHEELGPLARSFAPDAFWAILCDLVRRALAEASVASGDIAAVGVTSQRQAIVVLDRDGRALYAGPNMDVRAIAEGLTIDAQHGEQVYAATGMLPSVLSAPARLQWLRKQRGDDFSRATTVLAMGDWIAYRFTGEARSERSLAGGCSLLDVSTGERPVELLTTLEFPIATLPPLVDATDLVGQVSASASGESGLAAGTPVAIGGADTQCGLAGMGVEEPGEVGVVAGWSCPVQQVTAEARLDPERRTWGSVHAMPGRWVVESSASDAGHVWRWCCEMVLGDNGKALDEGSALAAEASAGAAGVVALLGPAAMNAGAMGLRLGGILMQTPLAAMAPVDRSALLRAVLENITYAIRANVEQAERVSGLPATRIVVGGGLTRAAIFSRILADVLDRSIEVASEVEVSARGAARLAARAAGVGDPGPAQRDSIEPDADASAAYRQRYERWRSLGEALQATQERA